MVLLAAAVSAAPPSSEVDRVPSFEIQARPDDIAVVIGVERYRGVPAAEFAAADARVMRDYLVAMGYPSRNVEFLSDDHATAADVTRALERWLPDRVKPNSRVVVYFSGHGAPDPVSGQAYLVPWDGNPDDLSDTAYSLKRLEDGLAKLPAAQVVVILDACFSGRDPKGRSLIAAGARPLVLTAPEPAPPSPKVALMTAARRSQISASNPDYRHGLFTYHLLKAVREGKKSLPDLYAALKPRVEDDAKARGVEQSPQLVPESRPDSPVFLLATFTSVSLAPAAPAVEKEEPAAVKAERKRLETEQRRLEAEKKRLQEIEIDLDRRRRELEDRPPIPSHPPVFVPPSF